jgi:hypothetical protein
VKARVVVKPRPLFTRHGTALHGPGFHGWCEECKSELRARRRVGVLLFAGVMFVITVWLLLGIAADFLTEPTVVDRSP